MIFVIDASALIDLNHRYPIGMKTFVHIWATLEKLIRDGNLFTSAEIKDEILDEKLAEWLKRFSNFYAPITIDIQKIVTGILQKFPKLIKLTSKGNSNADPFLIAVAIDLGIIPATIVTSERPSGLNSETPKIPDVAKKYELDCINLDKFINQIFE